MPPTIFKTDKIFAPPLTVYIPGAKTLPVTKTLISLILVKLTNPSVPMNVDLTLSFIMSEAALRERPPTLTIPTSGIINDPSRRTIEL